MIIDLHVKHPLFLSYLNETWIFSTDSRKNAQIWHFWKIRPVGAELFHAARRTDRQDEANSHISQNCEKLLKTKKIIIVI